MVSLKFIHIGMGDTGECIIRYAIHKYLERPKLVSFVNDVAHLSLHESRKFSSAPAFSFIRNPFDWYISFWIHRLKTQRWRGTFRSWMLGGNEGQGVCMYDFWKHFTEPGVEYVGQFETLRDDFARILSTLIPDIVSHGDVLKWFPDAYNTWGNRPWIECIEQHMREELYTPDLIERVYEQDKPIFEKWGYKYEDRYIF